MLNLTPLPAFNDNYIWLLQNQNTQQCAVVDPGDAQPVLDWLDSNPQWQLTDILITHHHGDHTGGVTQLKKTTDARVIGPANENIPSCDLAVNDQQIQVLGQDMQVLPVPGHTSGHIAYYCAGNPGFLLSGDALFAAGCGRMFEGTPEQMHASLTLMAQLPADTLLYCAHEYTLSNLKFAAAVEPDNQQIQQRLAQVSKLREHNGISLPCTLEMELATNPFLRYHLPQVQQTLHQHGLADGITEPATIFAVLRRWKDNF